MDPATRSPSEHSPWHHHKFHGVALKCNRPLVSSCRINAGHKPLTVTFSGTTEKVAKKWQEDGCSRLEDGQVHYIAKQQISALLSPEKIEIEYAPQTIPELFFLGRIFALWLELNGHTVLHGATVALDGERTVALIGPSGSGKSTLSNWLERQGCKLVTDDLIPLTPDSPGRVEPGIPLSRLWPDSATLLFGQNTFERLHPAEEKLLIPGANDGKPRFVSTSRNLRAIVILDRRRATENNRIEITPLSPARALVEINAQGYRPEALAQLDLTARRMAILAQTVATTPCYMLTFPNGLTHLPAIGHTVLHAMGVAK